LVKDGYEKNISRSNSDKSNVSSKASSKASSTFSNVSEKVKGVFQNFSKDFEKDIKKSRELRLKSDKDNEIIMKNIGSDRRNRDYRKLERYNEAMSNKPRRNK